MAVTVQFFGVCTHFRRDSLPPDRHGDWVHRVALVNASTDRIHQHPRLHEHDIEEHIALLQLRKPHPDWQPPHADWFRVSYEDSSVVQWKLEGVTLRIETAAGVPPAAPREPLPHLSDYCAAPVPALGPTAYELDATLTSCFFDFPEVVPEARIYAHGAVVSVVTVPVLADAAIEVTRFDGGTLSIPIAGDAEVTVANMPISDTSDKDADSLLHFLILTDIPSTAIYPERPFTGVALQTDNAPRNVTGLSGPGCSSQGYP